MATTALLKQRFRELSDQAEKVLATLHYENDGYIQGYYLDHNALVNWTVKVRNLLSNACGKDSEHYSTFEASEKNTGWSSNHKTFEQLRAIFDAAREDFEGGYLISVRNLVQAEVFSSELDQARELLDTGYKTAAAVIAGIVLETTLRQLCQDRGIPVGKLDRMNADLVKAGVYDVLVQKRITSLAAIRNSAAHGHPEQFTDADVSDLISYTERFISDQR